jgi:hypothetical protein
VNEVTKPSFDDGIHTSNSVNAIIVAQTPPAMWRPKTLSILRLNTAERASDESVSSSICNISTTSIPNNIKIVYMPVPEHYNL